MKSKAPQKHRRIHPGSLGIVEPSFDPMKTIGMEVAFYGGLASPHYRHPILKYLSLLLGFCLIAESIILYIVIFGYDLSYNPLLVVSYALLNSVLLLLGLRIVYANVQHKNYKRKRQFYLRTAS